MTRQSASLEAKTFSFTSISSKQISKIYLKTCRLSTNSVDHDQMLHDAVSDHGLRCLFRAMCPNTKGYYSTSYFSMTASVAQLDAPSDWRPGGRGFNPRRGRQHSFVEIDHEIFSTVILSLPLIQEGQLSVSGERMCTILVNRLED